MLHVYRRVVFGAAIFPCLTWGQPEPQPWSGEAEAGAVLVRGDTASHTLKARAQLVHERDTRLHRMTLDVLNAGSETATTTERYMVGYKTEYRPNDREYTFVNTNAMADRFSGYDYRLSASAGYGVRVVHRSGRTLDLEVGPGIRRNRLEDNGATTEVIVRMAGEFRWQVSPTASLIGNGQSEVGQDATLTKAVVSLSTQVVTRLSMKVSLGMTYATNVPAGKEEAGYESALTLAYGF